VTARHEAPAAALLVRAIGPARGVPGKLGRLGRALASYARWDEIDRRLGRLARLGVIDAVPTRLQLAVGGADMLRFFISPAAADYYQKQGIHYGFHQLLRFLDEPASLTDPVGLFSERDAIIGHLMQVVHANPVYDLQLLCMHERGLDALEEQIEAMLAGTHPRAGSIGAIVEEPDYHERLLAFVRAFRADPSIRPLRRSNVEGDPSLRRLDAVFGTLDAAMRYFARLPRTLGAAAVHLATADVERCLILAGAPGPGLVDRPPRVV
jgi:hypothetical protein